MGRLRCWLIALALALLSAPGLGETLEGVLSPGELVNGHKRWDDDCRACHVPLDRAAQSKLCADCHKAIRADMREKKRYHGRMKDTTCRRCHTEHQGRNAKITVLDKEKFDHNETAYALKGGHKKPEVKCEDCHKPGFKYRDAPKQCEACHKKIDNEKGHKGKLGAKCEDCHTEIKWKETKFDHNKIKFKLEQGHKDVKCKECHADQLYPFKDNPRACYACHKKDDEDPAKKGHKGHYGTKCEKCHDAAKWKESLFDHERDGNKYILKGKHLDAKCDKCHKEPLYTVKLPTACYACHKKDDEQKGHKGSLGEKCDKCHNEKNWKTSNFDHDRDTDYPLLGKHFDTKCDKCHKSGVVAVDGKPREKLPKACYACHKKDDDDPAKKGHKGKFGERCNSCHTAKEWKDIVFNHEWDTDYPLTGKHKETKCDDCHKPGEVVAKGVPRTKLTKTCFACHKKDDDDPAKKGHKGRFGEKCESCHTTKEWKNIAFNHERDTKYPLRGKHEKAACLTCHPADRYIYREKTSTECNACHRKDDYDKGHKGTLGVRCESCHNVNGWRVEKFDHNKSRFPLVGSHVLVECKKCHQNVAYRTTPIACNSCHERDDVHKRRLGTDCQTCHNMRTWKSWDFDHAKTGFKLEGGHAKPDCYVCHKVPMRKRQDTTLVTSCMGCHVKNDVHKGTFGGRCERCHGVTAWLPALRQ